MPIGIAVYTWYIERAFSIYMVYHSLRVCKKQFGYRAIYHHDVYRQTLYPMFSYVHPMFSYVYPTFSSVFLRLKTVYIHGWSWYIALHDMFISCLGPCRGCILRPAGPPECGAFAARLNAAHFKLLQQDTPGQAQTGLLLFLCLAALPPFFPEEGEDAAAGAPTRRQRRQKQPPARRPASPTRARSINLFMLDLVYLVAVTTWSEPHSSDSKCAAFRWASRAQDAAAAGTQTADEHVM